MSLLNNSLMAAAVLKASKQTDRALQAAAQKDEELRDLGETMKVLRSMAGAFNDRLAVARAERDGYKSLTVTIVNEIKGLAPKRLSLPDADQDRKDHLMQVYDASRLKYDKQILDSYAKLPTEARDGLLDNAVRRAGKGRLVKDFD